MLNRFNAGVNAAAVRALNLRPEDHALDLGFGGGVALDFLLQATPRGKVHGIDPSAQMVRRARRKWRRSVKAGHLQVEIGHAEKIPLQSESVDAAITINTLYFWPDPAAGFGEIARVLKPGGRLVALVAGTEHLMEMGFQKMGYRVEGPAHYQALAEGAGMVHLETRTPEAEEGSHLLVFQRPG
jgi:ubiquinone/menaquinone biosynthesis C-methylase UbiE